MIRLSAVLVLFATAPALAAPPTRVAVLIGVNDCGSASLPPLKHAERDIVDLAAVLRNAEYKVVALTPDAGKADKDLVPTADNVRKALEAVLTGRSRRDTVLVALSGHSIRPGDAKSAAFCPADADPAKPATIVNFRDILDRLAARGGTNVVLVDAPPGADAGIEASIEAPTGVVVLFGGKPGQHAAIDDAGGAFFRRTIEALGGAAKEDCSVTWPKLTAFVAEKVAVDAVKLVADEKARPTPVASGTLSGKAIIAPVYPPLAGPVTLDTIVGLASTDRHRLALHLLSDILAKTPRDATAKALRAYCLVAVGEPTAGLAEAEEAVKLDPKLAMAYIARCEAFAELKQSDKALADADKAVDLDPRAARLAGPRHGAGQTPQRPGRRRDRLRPGSQPPQGLPAVPPRARRGAAGVRAGGQGRGRPDGRRQGDRRRRRLPATVEGVPRGARIRPGRGRPERGRRAGRSRPALLRPAGAGVRRLEAVHEGAGRRDAGLGHGRPQRRRLPGAGAARMFSGQVEAAVLDCDKAVRFQPTNADAYLVRGFCLYDAGRIDKSLPDFTKCLELRPGDATAAGYRGNIYQSRGRYDDALKDFETALKAYPDDPIYRHRRGDCYLNRKEYAKALDDFNAAIKGDAKVAAYYVSRAQAYSFTGLYDKGVADCTKAIELDPKSANAFAVRGMVAANLKDYAKAIADLDKAESLGMKTTDLYRARSNVHTQAGNKAKADADRKTAEELEKKAKK